MQSLCRACHASLDAAERLQVNEMMFGTGEAFPYAMCPACGSLSLLDVPGDMSRFYPEGYYSMNTGAARVTSSRPARLVKRLRSEIVLRSGPSRAEALVLRGRAQPFLWWLAGEGVTTRSSVLDVGAGGGEILSHMREQGFADLLGIDPFLPFEEQTLPDGVRLRRVDVTDLDDTFDLVMMNHAFEHVPDPAATLRALKARLKPGGRVLIRVPVADSEAFTRYGKDWVQLDAPRHILVPTALGLDALAAGAGLRISRTFRDADGFQFWGSEQYRNGVPLHGDGGADAHRARFTAAQLAAWDVESKALNRDGRGDQAGFVLVPSGAPA